MFFLFFCFRLNGMLYHRHFLWAPFFYLYNEKQARIKHALFLTLIMLLCKFLFSDISILLYSIWISAFASYLLNYFMLLYCILISVQQQLIMLCISLCHLHFVSGIKRLISWKENHLPLRKRKVAFTLKLVCQIRRSASSTCHL